jgi:hypothetical protein
MHQLLPSLSGSFVWFAIFWVDNWSSIVRFRDRLSFELHHESSHQFTVKLDHTVKTEAYSHLLERFGDVRFT